MIDCKIPRVFVFQVSVASRSNSESPVYTPGKSTAVSKKIMETEEDFTIAQQQTFFYRDCILFHDDDWNARTTVICLVAGPDARPIENSTGPER